ncbi:MAG: glycosyltransferase family 4 protein [Thermodesulfobacteriota bacterium]|nr:glycosyltransferase family 4 protein [Thermodesulfobacteriota bacterium]
MRVLQVINVRWFNATSWYALYLGKLLAEAGHEVLILTLENTETHDKAKKWGLNTRIMDLNAKNPLKIAPLYFEIKKLLDTYRPDIVNCHRGEAFVLFGLLRKKSKAFRLVRTRGDQRPPRKNAVNKWLYGFAADAVVVPNSAMARHIQENLNVPKEKIHLILGGVDRKKFSFDPKGRDRVRKEFGIQPEHAAIGLLGRFDAVKGQKELIQAVSRLYHEHGQKQVRLLLIGFETATATREVQDWITEFNIGDITFITGERKDIPACVSALDLGVVPSLWSETIARAALEIMSCGRILTATEVGVMPDLLSPEAIVRPGDVDALTDLLLRTVTDRDFTENLRKEQARRMDGLSAKDFLSQTLELYEGLLK